jgi:glycine cleavage system H lipoate-binding protein
MSVILMLLMFSVFLVVDYFMRRNQVATQAAPVAEQQPLPRLVPATVAGFQVQENLSYHPGHTWALHESPSLVRVGMDDFAVKLAGKIERLALPQRGQWIRQGQKMLTMFRNGQSAEMVSPIEGTVTEINEAALLDPDVARKDPYGEGWLLRVDSPDAKTSFRNLLSGTLARSWMEDAARRLRARLSPTAVALAQDGGIAVDDLASQMPGQEWTTVAKEFFLA